MKKNIQKLGLLGIFLGFFSPIYAQDVTTKTDTNLLFFEWSITFLVIIAIFFAVVTFFISMQLLLILRKITHPELSKEITIWQVILGLKPLSKEKQLMLEDDYDGIRELNNPVPVWFNALFGGTIVFAFFYLLIYHVFNAADLQETEYNKEVQIAEVQKEAYLKKIASLIDEKNVQATVDAKSLEEGTKVYIANCASCHGQKGEGGIGPNLTDNYWLHGNSINHIFKTIKEGVPTKGMIAWQKKLNPLQIQKVASYILTLQGTNPPNGKEPQGEKLQPVKIEKNSKKISMK